MKKNAIVLIFVSLLVVNCSKSKITSEDTSKNQIANSDSSYSKQKVNTASEIFAKKQVPVLCYHRIENGRNDEYTVSPSAFEAQMKILADSGYHSVSPDELYNYLKYNAELPSKPFLITYDDSRVEHHEIAAPIMEKYGFHGTFFIMTITYNKKNYMTKDQIADLAKRGHTIGMHSWDHQMVTKYLTPQDWEKEVITPQKELEQITGKKVQYWAYPYGINSVEAAVELQKYFKLSFILSTKREESVPLQMIRRMIVPSGWSPQSMLKAMEKTFNKTI